MKSFSLRKTPNARLLFVKREGEQLTNWQQGLEEIEGMIRKHPMIEEADKFSDLYFFSSPLSRRDNPRYWVGREIIGPLFKDNNEGILVCDFHQGKCYEFRLAQESWEEIFQEEARWRKQLVKRFSTPLASTWRLRFDLEHSEAPMLNFFIK